MADWRWECVTDDLLDGLPPDALRAIRQLAKELAIRASMVFLDGPGFTGDPPGLRTMSFITRALADSYHAELVRAACRGLEFSPATGELPAWATPEP